MYYVKLSGIVFGLVIAFLLVALIVQGSDWFVYDMFAPKYEQTRRDTFETSRAFNQGLNQEIQNMRFEYEQASQEHRDALRSVILHRVAGDEDHLSSDLQSWVASLKEGNGQ